MKKSPTFLIFGIIILLLLSVVLGATNIPVDSKEYLGVKVEYNRNFVLGPNLNVKLPEKGYAIVTTSLLLPNGSLIELGTFTGEDRIKINYRKLTKAMELWNSYLKNTKLNPRAISPSLLLLGTLQDKSNNIQYFIEAVPINVEQVLVGRSIEIELPKDNLRVLYTKNQIEKTFKPKEDIKKYPQKNQRTFHRGSFMTNAIKNVTLGRVIVTQFA